MNDLERYFNQNTGRVIDKWDHYFEIYDRYFSRYRGSEVVVLEIGISNGGSLEMWKDYFGPKSKIYGLDINPLCKEVEAEGIKVFIGSQSDREFLNKVKAEIPPIDILIDDGGHTMRQQIVSFEELFDSIKPDGVYLCEDNHTSYWKNHGGGFRRMGTFIEYSKNFIDHIHAYHSKQRSFQVNSFTRSVYSVHYYDSILVLEKRPMEKPTSSRTGTITIPYADEKVPGIGGAQNKIVVKMSRILNRILYTFRLPRPF